MTERRGNILIYKHKGGWIIGHLIRVYALAVGKINESFKIGKFLFGDELVYVLKRWPKVSSAKPINFICAI